MKTKPAKASVTFGGLVANFYHAYGERKANGFLRLASKRTWSCFAGQMIT